MARSLTTAIDALTGIAFSLGLVVALILLIIRRQQLGRAAHLAIAGIAILFVNSLLDLVWPLALVGAVNLGKGGGMDEIRLVSTLLGLVSTLLYAGGLGLIIAAVFTGRPHVSRSDQPT